MGKLKDPRAEKERDYQHQRVITAEYPHLYVKSRRRKKQGTSRTHRRQIRQALHHNDGAQDYAEVDDLARKNPTLQAYSRQTAPLGKALQLKVFRRARTEAINQYKHQGNAQGAEGYFQDLMRRTHQNALTREVALGHRVLLEGHPHDGSDTAWHLNVYKKAWLEAFLQQHPQWRAHLEAWCQQVLDH